MVKISGIYVTEHQEEYSRRGHSIKAFRFIPILLILPLVITGCASTKKKQDKAADKDISGKIVGMVSEKSKEGVKRVAVLEFTSIEGDESTKGKLFSERLINELVNDGSVSVIERSSMDKLIEEQKLQASGIIDSSTAKNIGKMLGVDAVIIGTVTILGEEDEVNSRLINVETGEIIGAVTGRTVIRAGEGTSSEIAMKLRGEMMEVAKLKTEDPKEYKAVVARKQKIIKFKNKNPVLFKTDKYKEKVI